MGRQALAGINPVNIEIVKVISDSLNVHSIVVSSHQNDFVISDLLQIFPPISKLDPDLYGPPESAITEAHISGHLNGMSVHQVTILTLMCRHYYAMRDSDIKKMEIFKFSSNNYAKIGWLKCYVYKFPNQI